MAVFSMPDGGNWNGIQQILPQLNFLKLELKIYRFGGNFSVHPWEFYVVIMADASWWVLATFRLTTVWGTVGIPTTINPNFYSFLIGKKIMQLNEFIFKKCWLFRGIRSEVRRG